VSLKEKGTLLPKLTPPVRSKDARPVLVLKPRTLTMATASETRQEEKGVLQTPLKVKVYLAFKRFPIWLLALDLVAVRHVWIMGWKT
jgi:hypothetical protein